MFQDYSYGIIPVRRQAAQVQYLVVKHFYGKHWGFPKGHPEGNECPVETAVRELFEETGFNALDPLEDEFHEHYSFVWQGRRCQKTVTYFISKVEGSLSFNTEEISAVQWVCYQEALNLFNFHSAKSTITKARLFLSERDDYL